MAIEPGDGAVAGVDDIEGRGRACCAAARLAARREQRRRRTPSQQCYPSSHAASVGAGASAAIHLLTNRARCGQIVVTWPIAYVRCVGVVVLVSLPMQRPIVWKLMCRRGARISPCRQPRW